MPLRSENSFIPTFPKMIALWTCIFHLNELKFHQLCCYINSLY